MEWIDTSCRGGTARDHAHGTPTVEQLLAEMDRLHIHRALVTSVWADNLAPEYANQQLFDDLQPFERLYPVPEVLPASRLPQWDFTASMFWLPLLLSA